jgi:hypothetical protein
LATVCGFPEIQLAGKLASLIVTAFKHVVAFPVGEMAHRVMEGFRRIAGTYSRIITDT